MLCFRRSGRAAKLPFYFRTFQGLEVTFVACGSRCARYFSKSSNWSCEIAMRSTAYLLYVVSTVFVCYLSFKQVVSRPSLECAVLDHHAFCSAECGGPLVSFKRARAACSISISVISPQAFVFAKMLYNAALMMVIGVLAYTIYVWWIGDMVQDHGLFHHRIAVGQHWFCFYSHLDVGHCGKDGQQHELMAILSFPVQLPFLLTLIKLSKNAVDGLDWSVSYELIAILVLLQVIIVTLSVLLFPYLWRD
jgi:heme exporter protein B